jgi:hypothetical protein
MSFEAFEGKENKLTRQDRTDMIKAGIKGHPGHLEYLGQMTGQP